MSPSLRTASCCSVDVMKGAAADRDRGFLVMFVTVKLFETFFIASVTALESFSEQ